MEAEKKPEIEDVLASIRRLVAQDTGAASGAGAKPVPLEGMTGNVSATVVMGPGAAGPGAGIAIAGREQDGGPDKAADTGIPGAAVADAPDIAAPDHAGSAFPPVEEAPFVDLSLPDGDAYAGAEVIHHAFGVSQSVARPVIAEPFSAEPASAEPWPLDPSVSDGPVMPGVAGLAPPRAEDLSTAAPAASGFAGQTQDQQDQAVFGAAPVAVDAESVDAGGDEDLFAESADPGAASGAPPLGQGVSVGADSYLVLRAEQRVTLSSAPLETSVHVETAVEGAVAEFLPAGFAPIGAAGVAAQTDPASDAIHFHAAPTLPSDLDPPEAPLGAAEPALMPQDAALVSLPPILAVYEDAAPEVLAPQDTQAPPMPDDLVAELSRLESSIADMEAAMAIATKELPTTGAEEWPPETDAVAEQPPVAEPPQMAEFVPPAHDAVPPLPEHISPQDHAAPPPDALEQLGYGGEDPVESPVGASALPDLPQNGSAAYGDQSEGQVPAPGIEPVAESDAAVPAPDSPAWTAVWPPAPTVLAPAPLPEWELSAATDAGDFPPEDGSALPAEDADIGVARTVRREIVRNPDGAYGIDEDPEDEDDVALEDASCDLAAEQTDGQIDAAEAEPVSEAAVLDEEELRLLVARLIREEFRGALGERITQNVRKLVRREIQRSLLDQSE